MGVAGMTSVGRGVPLWAETANGGGRRPRAFTTIAGSKCGARGQQSRKIQTHGDWTGGRYYNCRQNEQAVQ